MSKCFSWFSWSCCVAVCGLGLFAFHSTRADDQPVKKPAEAPAAEAKAAVEAKPAAKPDRATLEKELEKQLSGCVFVGKFTVVGREDQAPKEERYTITKVKKQDNGKWIFVARIQYGTHDVQVPMELDVEWAGDTPVITLTDLAIPGLGTFTSRVLVYRGWYSGTWLHGPVGGHLFGRIEKLPAEKKTDKKPETKADKKDEKQP
ncbi:MAG: hypothetical protein JWM11_6893 [Planctomycetaceae bacterium]|nr:hypothetical protein [Planctomycetaceae bacterium]